MEPRVDTLRNAEGLLFLSKLVMQGVVECVLYFVSVFPQLHFESSEMCGLIEAGYCLTLQTNHCLHIHLSIYYSKVLF